MRNLDSFDRDFVYCHSLVGTEYARIDHLRHESVPMKPMGQGKKEPWSPASILHLPQHTFESLLANDHRRYLDHIGQNQRPDSPIQHWTGYEAKLHRIDPSSGCMLQLKKQESTRISKSLSTTEVSLHCDYVVAADGAHSLIRQQLGIPMEGPQAMQHLMNIHFRCPGLKSHLSARPGMLYFVFHPQLVAVFVSHSPLHDEWVCQIPFFPPFQSAAVSLFLLVLSSNSSAWL